MDTQPTTHIYLNGTKRDEILRDATPEQKYILEMNERLQCEVSELRQSLTDKDSLIEEYEEISARDDKSKTYMRGLVVNYGEQIETHKEIHKLNESLLALSNKHSLLIGERLRMSLIGIQFLSIISAHIGYLFQMKILILLSVLLIILLPSVPQYKQEDISRTPDGIRKRIKMLTKSLKDVDIAQEGLRQYLDEC